MSDSFGHTNALSDSRFLWVDLTREGSTALVDVLDDGKFDIRLVRETTQIPSAIQIYAPLFLCFEFDEPDAPSIDALNHIRREHPSLPVLMITGYHSEAVAMWALRIRAWDLLVKPVLIEELNQHITALNELTSHREPRPAEIPFPPHGTVTLTALHGVAKQRRTCPATSYVATHFDRKIVLDHVAALCRLSPSQFCRVFRQEQGVSFGQYLLRYRIERACDCLGHPGTRVKEVAYSVGFNDLSYFTRAFKRQVGVCPSKYQVTARLS